MTRFAVDLDDASFLRLIEQAKRRGVDLHETAAVLLKQALEGREPTTVALVLGLGRQLRAAHDALMAGRYHNWQGYRIGDQANESAAVLGRYERWEAERFPELGVGDDRVG